MSSTPLENRRGTPRNHIDCLIRVEALSADSPAQNAPARPACEGTIVQDVSATGARIWAEQPFAVGEQLLISFGCGKVGLDEETSCVASVVWAEDQATEGRWQIGIHFREDAASQAIADALLRGCPWCEKQCPEIAAPQPLISDESTP